MIGAQVDPNQLLVGAHCERGYGQVLGPWPCIVPRTGEVLGVGGQTDLVCSSLAVGPQMSHFTLAPRCACLFNANSQTTLAGLSQD